MAFIGGTAENQVKVLRQRIAQKDQQVTTLMNEAQKKQEAFDELKRAKDSAAYNAQQEAGRAKKAEDSLAAKISELSNCHLKIDNLNSTLMSVKEQVSDLEKENRQLQRNFNNSQGDASHAFSTLQKEHQTLKAKAKDMELELRRAEIANENRQASSSTSSDTRELEELRKEVQRLRVESRKVSLPGSPAAAMMAMRSAFAAPPPPSPSPRTKRTKSFSSHVGPQTDSLRSQLAEATKEIETSKNALNSAKRELLKTENEKLALERSLGREVEALKDKLETSTSELRHLRREGESSGGGSSSAERLLKEAQRKREEAEQRVERLSEELVEKDREISRLQTKVEGLEKTVATERSSKAIAEEHHMVVLRERDASLADAEVIKLQHATEVGTLKSALDVAQSRVITPVTAPLAQQTMTPGVDKTVRQLQGELASSRREREALEENLRESDEILATQEKRIAELTAGRGVALEEQSNTRADEQIADLEREKEMFGCERETLLQKIADAQATGERLSAELKTALAETSAVKQALRSAEGELEAARAEQQNFASSRDSVLQNLETLKATLLDQTQQVERLESDLAICEQERKHLLEDHDIAAKAANRRSAEQDSVIVALRQERDTLVGQVAESQAILVSHTHNDVEFDTLAAEHADLTCRLAASEATLEQAKFREFEQQQQILDTSEESKDLRERCAKLDTTIRTLRSEVSKIATQLEAERDEMILERRGLEERLETVAAELQSAQQMIADRSTESETQQRDLDLIQLREDNDGLQHEVEALQAELDLVAGYLAEKDTLLASQVEQIKLMTVSLAKAVKAEASLSFNMAKAERMLEELHEEHRNAQRLLDFAESERLTAAQETLDERERLITRIMEAEHRATDLDGAGQAAQAVAIDLQSQIEKLAAKLDQSEKDLEAAGLSIEDAVQDAKSADKRLQEAATSLHSVRAELSVVTAQRDEASKLVHLQELSPDNRIEALQVEIIALRERVNRREQTIAAEQARSRKIAFNLDLAEQSIIDNEERTAGFMRDRDEVAAQLAALKVTLAQKDENHRDIVAANRIAIEELRAKAEVFEVQDGEMAQHLIIELARATINLRDHRVSSARDIQTHVEALAEVTSSLQSLRTALEEHQSRSENAKAELAEVESAHSARLDFIRSERDTTERQLDARTAERDLMDERCQSLVEKLQSQKAQAAEDSEDHERLISSLRAEVVEGITVALEREAEVSSLRGQLTAGEERLAELTEQLSSKTAELQDWEASWTLQAAEGVAETSRLETRITQLQLEVEANRAEVERSMVSTLDEVREELAESQAHAERLQSALSLAASDAESKSTKAQAELEDARTALSAALDDLQEQTDKSAHAAAESAEKLFTAEQKVVSLSENLRIAQDQAQVLRDERQDSSQALQAAELKVSRKEAELRDLQEQAQNSEIDARARFAMANEKLEAMRTSLATLQQSAELSQGEKRALQDEIESYRTQLADQKQTLQDASRSLAMRESELTISRDELVQAKAEFESRLSESQATQAMALRRLSEVTDRANADLVSAREEIVTLQERIHASAARIAELEGAATSDRPPREDLLAAQRIGDELRASLRVSEGKAADLERQIAELEGSQGLSDQLENLVNENSRHLDDLMAIRKERKTLEKRIGQLERKLKTAETARDSALQQIAAAPQPVQPTLSMTGTPGRRIAGAPLRAGILTPRSGKLQSPMHPVSGQKRGREMSSDSKVGAKPVYAPAGFEKGGPQSAGGMWATDGTENLIPISRKPSPLFFETSPRE